MKHIVNFLNQINELLLNNIKFRLENILLSKILTCFISSITGFDFGRGCNSSDIILFMLSFFPSILLFNLVEYRGVSSPSKPTKENEICQKCYTMIKYLIVG